LHSFVSACGAPSLSVIPIGHDSGGPRSDIIVPEHTPSEIGVGYRATSVEEYSLALLDIFASKYRGSAEMARMRRDARQRASEFSDQTFEAQITQLLMPVIIQWQTSKQ
jgi:hypothetical protein